jgi:lysozyme
MLKELMQPLNEAKTITLHVSTDFANQPDKEYDSLQYSAGYEFPVIKVRTTTFTKPNIELFAFKVGYKFMPDLMFIITDDNKSFKNTDYPIKNDIVTVYMGNQYDVVNKPIHLDFRINKVQTLDSKGNSKHIFYCELAFENQFNNANVNIRDTSFNAIKLLCADMKLGLVSNIENTNDLQFYKQNAMNNIDYLINVCSQIYVSDETIVHCFIDQHYRLNVVDINKVLDGKSEIKKISKDVIYFNDLETPEEVVFTNDRFANHTTQFNFIDCVPTNNAFQNQANNKPIESVLVKKDYKNASIKTSSKNTKVSNNSAKTQNATKKSTLENNTTESIRTQTITVEGQTNDNVKQLSNKANDTKLNYVINNQYLTVTMEKFTNMFHLHQLINVIYYSESATTKIPQINKDTNNNTSLEPLSTDNSQVKVDAMSGDYSIVGMLLTYDNKSNTILQKFKLAKKDWESQKYETEDIDLSDAMYGAPAPYTMPDLPPPPQMNSGDGNYSYNGSLGNWLNIARGELGTAEYAGDANNARIQEYHRLGGGLGNNIADAVHWCGSFVGWCMLKAGYPKAQSAASAISWASYGVPCQPGTIGAIVVMKLRPGSVTSSGNHVAFCRGMQGNKVLTIGGNQGSNGAVTESSVDISKVFAWRLPSGSPSQSTYSKANGAAASKPFKISSAGLAFLKRKEGCKLQAYQDSGGVWTIGYGHTKTARPGMQISYQQAELLLKQDLQFFERSLTANINVSLTQSMVDAAISFIYNLGPGKMSKTSQVGSLVNNKQYLAAGNAMLSYNTVKGKVLSGLSTRRQEERQMFLSQGSNVV